MDILNLFPKLLLKLVFFGAENAWAWAPKFAHAYGHEIAMNGKNTPLQTCLMKVHYLSWGIQEQQPTARTRNKRNYLHGSR